MQAEETLFSFISLLESFKAPHTWDKKTLTEQIKEIATHPFIVREMAKQSEDLRKLKEVETLDRDFLEWLHTSYNNHGKSLIDLS